MSHDEASELLGAYALDAVDGDERSDVETHLVECPRCVAELDTLREVAAALGNTVEPLPEGLWSRLASRLSEPDAEEEPPPLPRLLEGAAAPGSAAPFRSAPRHGPRRRRTTQAALAVLAVAVAAVAVVLGVGLVRADNRVSTLQGQAAHPSATAAALRTPGHRLVDLVDPRTHDRMAEFVVVPDGRGYLVSSSLPALGSSKTYQLWGIVGNRPISLGLLGNAPRQATFTVAGATRPSSLAVTVEPAGGTRSPTLPILASGTV
jgi:anti-sigma-K factor RskA